MASSFIPLLFGGDINVYSMARAFHEAYGIPSICYGKYPSGPAYNSAIIDYRPCAQNEVAEVFCKNVATVAAEHPDKTILVIGCGDSYVKLAAENKGKFPENCVAPYVDAQLINTLIDKEQFYALCDQYGVDHPATVVHRALMGHDFELPFDGPFVCKPANGVAYWAHPFEGNEKVFICPTRERLNQVLDMVYASGYDDAMIIQDFIPGDDSNMRVLTSYSNQAGQVTLMCLGHVLLEEHSPYGIGNHAVILTEPNEALCQKMRQFLEAVHFTGFSNFDIKYDPRDGKYKAFEINCRQGRSNYYVTGAGHNLARTLVDDVIEHKNCPLHITTNRSLWRMVPQKLAFDYTPSAYHQEMRTLIAAGASTHSLRYPPDRGFMRYLRFLKGQWAHFGRFKTYYKKPQ